MTAQLNHKPDDLLDEALAIGVRELDLLRAGEIEAAEESAQRRGGRMGDAFALRAADPSAVDVDRLRDKLDALQLLQADLTAEAKRLHAEMRAEIARMRMETDRLGGYAKSFDPAHGVPRFVSRRG